MKKFKIFLNVIAVLILVLIIAAVIFVMTFDINRYKTQIVNQASAALGRKVDFKSAKLDISLKQGLSLKITNLGVADDPAFGKEDFLAVKEASFAIDVFGLIFNKKVNVSGILIDSPRITLIREKNGSFNISSLAEAGKKDAVAGKAAAVSSPIALPALLISSIRITRGTVVYIDRMVTPALLLEIGQIGMEANKVSLSAAFPFVAEAAVLSDQKNIRLEAKVGLDLKKNAVTVSGLKAEVELERIILEKIPVYFPLAKDISLPNSLKGQAQFLFNDFTISGKGLSVFSAEASLENGYLQFKDLASPIQDLALSAKITQNDIFLNKISAVLGQGKLKGSGKLQDYLSTQKYSLQASAENLTPQDIIIQDKSGVEAEGVVSVRLALDGRTFSPEAIKTNLSGEAGVSVISPRLKNVNILRTVLDKVTVIPGLSEKIKASLPELFRQKLTQKDTIFSKINLPVTVANGRLLLKEIVLKADEFLFEGWGEAGFDSSFFLEGAFIIPPELSQAMVAAVSQLQYLLSTGNQIYIPLRVSGNTGKLEFNVDAAYIANKLLAEQGKKQLLKVLDKALGTKEEPSREQQKDSPKEPVSEEKTPTSEEAVKGLLQEIFR
jgi:hypothetical protein